MGWIGVVVGGKMLFQKRRGGGRRRAGGRAGERGECVTALGKFKVTAPSTAAGSRSGDRRRNFAASRPCVCARGSVSELHPKVFHKLKKERGKIDKYYTEEPTKASAAPGAKKQHQTQKKENEMGIW